MGLWLTVRPSSKPLHSHTVLMVLERGLVWTERARLPWGTLLYQMSLFATLQRRESHSRRFCRRRRQGSGVDSPNYLTLHCHHRSRPALPPGKPQWSGIANLTFDLVKLHPKEFLGCLSIRATLYEMYMFSYDLRCTKAKPAINCLSTRGSMRLLTNSQLLLYRGRYIPCIHYRPPRPSTNV